MLDGITGSMDMNLSKLPEVRKDREARCAVVHGVPKNKTYLNMFKYIFNAQGTDLGKCCPSIRKPQRP